MATPSILGQGVTSGTNTFVLVDGPCVISTLFVCNAAGASRTFNIQARRSGEETSPSTNQQYLYKAHALALAETAAITGGIALGDGETLLVSGSASDIAFTAFGVRT